ncbi:hypothetical protein LP420_22260 [Massilia sp. B-10]|nr:hypothetical protein LP420_22260 [Massilia sp. B-10]UUZ52234.1 hypothetical protein LP419_21730 [Massilia sp. H-1]
MIEQAPSHSDKTSKIFRDFLVIAQPGPPGCEPQFIMEVANEVGLERNSRHHGRPGL